MAGLDGGGRPFLRFGAALPQDRSEPTLTNAAPATSGRKAQGALFARPEPPRVPIGTIGPWPTIGRRKISVGFVPRCRTELLGAAGVAEVRSLRSHYRPENWPAEEATAYGQVDTRTAARRAQVLRQHHHRHRKCPGEGGRQLHEGTRAKAHNGSNHEPTVPPACGQISLRD